MQDELKGFRDAAAALPAGAAVGGITAGDLANAMRAAVPAKVYDHSRDMDKEDTYSKEEVP
eukprot:979116-Rhodomonas_salina.1